MTQELTLQLKGDLESVHTGGNTAAEWLASQGAPAPLEYFGNLVIEEFGTNCVKYGFDPAREHSLEIALSLSSEGLTVTIVDDGQPFNPLEVPQPDLGGPVEERPVGGLGIYLVRRMADRIDYAREGRFNRLTLFKGSGAAIPAP